MKAGSCCVGDGVDPIATAASAKLPADSLRSQVTQAAGAHLIAPALMCKAEEAPNSMIAADS